MVEVNSGGNFGGFDGFFGLLGARFLELMTIAQKLGRKITESKLKG